VSIRVHDRLGAISEARSGAAMMGRFIVREGAVGELFMNSLAAHDGMFVVPESAGRWHLLRGSERVEGTFPRPQMLDPLDVASIRTVGRSLGDLIDQGGTWLNALDVSPLVPACRTALRFSASSNCSRRTSGNSRRCAAGRVPTCASRHVLGLLDDVGHDRLQSLLGLNPGPAARWNRLDEAAGHAGLGRPNAGCRCPRYPVERWSKRRLHVPPLRRRKRGEPGAQHFGFSGAFGLIHLAAELGPGGLEAQDPAAFFRSASTRRRASLTASAEPKCNQSSGSMATISPVLRLAW
jgi:hypothetical protein